MHIVVGDIHGCFNELVKLLDKIGPSADDTIVSIGDLVDRGPMSPEVVTFFMRKPNTRSMKGNHERKHERFRRGLIAERHFGRKQRGTVRQFDNRDPKTDLVSYAQALDYFETLPLYLELPSAILVHAGLIYGIPLESQNEKILTGAGFKKENRLNKKTGLFEWCNEYPEDAKPVIFGHLGVGKAPWPLPKRKNLWPIDTGCVSGGYLTAVTLPDFVVYQIKTSRKKK